MWGSWKHKWFRLETLLKDRRPSWRIKGWLAEAPRECHHRWWFCQVVKEEKLQEGDFQVESSMSFGGLHWCRTMPSHEHRPTEKDEHRSRSVSPHWSIEEVASCATGKIPTHEEFAAKHPYPPKPLRIKKSDIDRHKEPDADRHLDSADDRHNSPSVDRRQLWSHFVLVTLWSYRILMLDLRNINYYIDFSSFCFII